MTIARVRTSAPATTSPVLNFDQVATAQLAVDRKNEQRLVSQAALPVEMEPDGPDLLLCQWSFGAYCFASIPRGTRLNGGIKS